MPKKEPETEKPKRGRGRPRGVTAKVAGRTKTLREVAETYGEEMIFVLAQIAMDEKAPHGARTSAANSLLDRGYGRPAQADPTPADSPDKVLQRIERIVIDRPVAVAKKKAPVKKEAAK